MSAAKEAPKEPAKDAAAPAGDAAAKAAAKPANPLIPIIAVVVLAPVLSFVVFQFFILPGFKKELAAAPAAEHGAEAGADPHAAEEAAPAAEEAGGHGGGHGKKEGGKESGGVPNAYEFENVVVNLAGTMGTRYLKSSFLVTGADKNIRSAFEKNKPKMVDVTLNVLSSLSLADLEEAGSKNLIREKLIGAYNQAIGKRMVEQIYFTDFVVQ